MLYDSIWQRSSKRSTRTCVGNLSLLATMDENLLTTWNDQDPKPKLRRFSQP
ncbi:hypothetical protein AG1IA_07448 [Rhizoctonia solani AG-1 IA]|uniref:Uncharacterized protein n=1 Tax=Thanatephorus cucumeris (strain AG1-IA) TaxID=983506 RepID=L8WP10_THACA|nr:hypothetical protein AG1IA_07448 [Rhizoctonia solani AG-1 IA]